MKRRFRCTKKQSLYGSAIGGVIACTILILVVIIKYTGSAPNSHPSNKGNGNGLENPSFFIYQE